MKNATILALLDAVKAAQGLTEYAIAIHYLGIKQARISDWKSGRLKPADEHVVALAKLANQDEVSWLIRYHAEQADSDKMSQVWREAQHRMAS